MTKKKNLYDMIYSIDNDFEGLHFHKIIGVSIVGSPLSTTQDHPIQYHATTNLRFCDDSAFEGMGWTPTEAVRNLLKILKETQVRTKEIINN